MLFRKKNKRTTIILRRDEDAPPISEWLENGEAEAEGQLALDVFQTDDEIVIKSTIAGVRPEDLKISLHNDLLTIKGERSLAEDVNERDYLYRECYWGSFSRSIILPAEVDNKHVEANLQNGVLTIRLHKSFPEEIRVAAKK